MLEERNFFTVIFYLQRVKTLASMACCKKCPKVPGLYKWGFFNSSLYPPHLRQEKRIELIETAHPPFFLITINRIEKV